MPPDPTPARDVVLPSVQLAVVITAPGEPEVLQVRSMPVKPPGPHEVLIRVLAAGVNRHDCHQRRRGPSPQHSDVPGLEVAGEVVAMGMAVSWPRLGDTVCALVDGGGYADYALAQAAQTLPLPERFTPVQAASLPEAAFTVWHNFFNVATLAVGESVLLHGGTSGVGVFAIQLLTALGHPVYATCGSDEKQRAAQALGAVQAFDHRSPTWSDGLLDATGGRGVDVVLDMSGGRHAHQSMRALARRGRIVHLSPGQDAVFDAPLRAIMAKEAKVTGSLMRPLPDDEKARIAERLRTVVWPWLSAGRIRPVVHAVLPLQKAAQAHRLMEEGRHIGKIVLQAA